MAIFREEYNMEKRIVETKENAAEVNIEATNEIVVSTLKIGEINKDSQFDIEISTKLDNEYVRYKEDVAYISKCSTGLFQKVAIGFKVRNVAHEFVIIPKSQIEKRVKALVGDLDIEFEGQYEEKTTDNAKEKFAEYIISLCNHVMINGTREEFVEKHSFGELLTLLVTDALENGDIESMCIEENKYLMIRETNVNIEEHIFNRFDIGWKASEFKKNLKLTHALLTSGEKDRYSYKWCDERLKDSKPRYLKIDLVKLAERHLIKWEVA